jgi:hypothetical protein
MWPTFLNNVPYTPHWDFVYLSLPFWAKVFLLDLCLMDFYFFCLIQFESNYLWVYASYNCVWSFVVFILEFEIDLWSLGHDSWHYQNGTLVKHILPPYTKWLFLPCLLSPTISFKKWKMPFFLLQNQSEK